MEGNILWISNKSVLLETRYGRQGDQIIRVDRSTGARKVLARSEFHPGEIDSAALIGDWLVYNDLRGAVTNGDVPYPWRVFALNLRTHEKKLLDRNGRLPDLMKVTIWSRSGTAVWTKANEGSGPRVGGFKLWKPGWSEPVRIAVLPSRLGQPKRPSVLSH